MYGTDAVDSVSVEANLTSFTVNFDGKSKTYRNGSIKLIRVFAGGGDDSIILSPKLMIRASIEGGAGNDRIGGGALDDTIMGQGGDDTIAGNLGSDYLDGGPGNDILEKRFLSFSGMEVSVLHGGGGNDRAGFPVASDTITSGVETIYSAGPGTLYPQSATIAPVAGRTELQLRWYKPSGDDWTYTGPTQLANGQYEVRLDDVYQRLSSDDFPQSHNYDLTGLTIKGVIFTLRSTSALNEVTAVSVPLYLPQR